MIDISVSQFHMLSILLEVSIDSRSDSTFSSGVFVRGLVTG